jgi:SAM-dependent methyltransferase
MTARRRREWFDDDSFWRDLYPYMFPESRFAAAIVDAGKALRLARPKGKAVLDLCCGPGRFSIALAKRRFAVTGVDRTKYLLDKARARARAAGVKVEWVKQDMRDFVRPGAFDLALSMFTSFGYFDDKREDVGVLENIRESLRPGGVCLIEVGGKEWLARIFAPTTSAALPDGSMLVQRHVIFDDWTRIRNEWTLIRRGRAKTFRFHHTIYSGQELRDRMEQAGFTRVKLFGTLDGDEYGPNANRLIAIGRKPGR